MSDRMKLSIITALLLVTVYFITGCDKAEVETLVDSLEIQGVAINTSGITGLAFRKQNVVAARSALSLASVSVDNSADLPPGREIVIEDQSTDLRVLLPGNHKAHHYAVGKKHKSEGRYILAVNTRLSVIRKETGKRADCVVMALYLGNSGKNPVCLQLHDDQYDPEIPVAVTPEEASQNDAFSSTPGDQENVYFILNRPSGGYMIKRWDGADSISIIHESVSGRMDKIHSGEALIAVTGRDGTVDIMFQGSPGFGWGLRTDVGQGLPVLFNDTLFFTKVPNPANGGFFNLHINLTVGNTVSYANQTSLDCGRSDKQEDIFTGSKYAYWISAGTNKLCSVTPDPGNTSLYGYSIVDASTDWQYGVAYEETLFLYGFDQAVPHLEQVDMTSGVITKINRLTEYGLAYVTGLSHYQSGIKITGIKAVTGGGLDIFYHVRDATVDLNPGSTVTLYNFGKL